MRGVGAMNDDDLLRFDGQVALITGAGRGLGRAHALLLASRGCKIVVNDVSCANDVVAEIIAAGGAAVANSDSVEDGARVVAAVLKAYGHIDILVNNAGVLTPETWADMTPAAWQRTLAVNLTAVYGITQAAWPAMVRAKFGRVIMVASPSIFGAGVAAYAASKAGLIGLSASLTFEATKLKVDIGINTVIPQASTQMTSTFAKQVNEKRVQEGKRLLPEVPAELRQLMAPANTSAMVAFLAHRSCTHRATIHEAGAGYFAQLRWARSAPLFATAREGIQGPPLPEHVRDGSATLADFEGGDTPPSGDGSMGGPNALERVMSHL
jgi:(3R)-3-hydroxyacyl-CoA dehydrogenase / 3a,7a,12a-trihydroxy-5b-cholest-24-enoyl-CoA hydratase / enoyl-CoA hydratase 2